MKTRYLRFLSPLAALCWATIVFGQTAPLRGIVVDPQGQPIQSARLTLFNSATAGQIGQVQTIDGRFEFSAVPAGRYLIETTAEGFRQTAVRLDFRAGANTTVKVRLEIEGVQQSILVTAEAAAQSLDETAKAVSVIDRPEIDNRNEYSLYETLRNTPGLTIRNLGGPGQSTSIRSRGLGPSATAILIDGMRFRDVATTQGDASSFLGGLNIVNPKRVEVLRGSGSSLYGTNAVGGIINIVTEQGGVPAHGDLQLEGGSLGLLRGRGSLGGATLHNRLLYSGGLLHLNVLRGVNGNDRARSTGAQGFARYQLREGLLASARFLGSDDFVQPNSSPTATGIPAIYIPNTTIVPALPFTTFIPSRDDPDNRRASRFSSSAFKLQQTVNALLNWQ
ncbi:MAG TPA: TonB-dependent receptor plug domain-containing protein, partial [Bryobacteraceae bacterium]|nr:TonB-dependent receptor plug domain-containing protein [Bryobacteraceae bacterium]